MGRRLTALQKAISDAASDAASSLFRSPSGLGDDLQAAMGAEAGSTQYTTEQAAAASSGGFDIGSLLNTAIGAAAKVATATISAQTTKRVAEAQADLQAAQARMLQRQAELQAGASGATTSSFSLTSPLVLIPAILGGGLLLYSTLRK